MARNAIQGPIGFANAPERHLHAALTISFNPTNISLLSLPRCITHCNNAFSQHVFPKFRKPGNTLMLLSCTNVYDVCRPVNAKHFIVSCLSASSVISRCCACNIALSRLPTMSPVPTLARRGFFSPPSLPWLLPGTPP